MRNNIALPKGIPQGCRKYTGQLYLEENTANSEYLTSLVSSFYELGTQQIDEEQCIKLANLRNELIVAEDTIEDLRAALDQSRQQRDLAQDKLEVTCLSIQQSLLMMERLLLELEARQELGETHFLQRELKKISTHLSQRV